MPSARDELAALVFRCRDANHFRRNVLRREKIPYTHAEDNPQRRHVLSKLRDKRVAVIVAILLLSMVVPGRTSPQQSNKEHQKVWGRLYKAQPNAPVTPQEVAGNVGDSMVMLHHWNHVAVDASGLDHTPVAPGENRVFGEQVGPCRASRAEAIVHIAIFEAVNSIVGGYQSYVGIGRAPATASVSAAIAQAAHDTLCAMFPSQTPAMNAQLVTDLSQIPNSPNKTSGIKVGQKAAAAILAMRAGDGSEIAEPKINTEFIPSNAAGFWRQDPISHGPLALGAH